MKIFMKKIKFLFVSALAVMAVSCASSSADKESADSTATASTEVVAPTEGEVVAQAEETGDVITYEGGNIFEVPAGAMVSPQSVKDTQHTTVIEFGATWCGPCKQAKPVVENLAGKYKGQAEFLYVDIDNCPEVAKEFGVGQSIPVVVVVKADGTFEKVEGLEPIKSQLDSKIADALKK